MSLLSSAFSRLGRSILIVVLAVFCAFPVYWMVVTALVPLNHLFDKPPALLPHLGGISVFSKAIHTTPVLHWFGNSAVLAIGVTVFSVLLGLLAGYALSRYSFRGKGLTGLLFLATQMLPETLAVVPLYTLFLSLGLLNDLFGLVIVDTAFVMPVVAWILKAAVDAVPIELEEAARVDGCRRLAILQIVVAPLVWPSIAAGGIIAFFYGWNEYVFASTFITQPSKWTASTGMASFVGQYITPVDLVFASTVMYTALPIVFYLIAQRKLISGLTAGAVKG